jgi:hypothetical protein
MYIISSNIGITLTTRDIFLLVSSILTLLILLAGCVLYMVDAVQTKDYDVGFWGNIVFSVIIILFIVGILIEARLI